MEQVLKREGYEDDSAKSEDDAGHDGRGSQAAKPRQR
jgi:hypothetical protein